MNEITVKDHIKEFTVEIKESESVKNAVHLMTKGRECVWVKFDASKAAYIVRNTFGTELLTSGKHRKSVYFLHTGKQILSRDLTDTDEIKNDEEVRYAINAGAEILTHKQAVQEGIFEGAKLKITLYTYTEEEANSLFLGEILQFKSKKRSPYMDVMFLGIDLKLKPITNNPDETISVHGGLNEYMDLADLTAYKGLRKILLSKHIYEDDFNIEYAVSTGDKSAYYILDEWYSNHVWARDPAILYVFRATAHITEETFPREDLRHKHPIRYTESIWDNKGAREDYYIESVDTEFKTNHGIKIFVSRKRKEKNPKEGFKSFDTLFDFNDWLGYRDSEIFDA